MPKEWTHWVLAERLPERLASGSIRQEALSRFPHLFHIAAVAADSPFYDLSAKADSPGLDLHDSVVMALQPALRTVAHFPWPLPTAVAAFLVGFISHMAVDATFHPVLIHFAGSRHSGQKEQARIRHRQLESWLDLHYAACAPSLLNLGRLALSLIRCEIPLEQAAGMLATCLWGQENEHVNQARRMLHWHGHIQAQFLKKWPVMILKFGQLLGLGPAAATAALFYPRKKPEKVSFFAQQISFRHPISGAAQCTTLAEMEEKAIAQALASTSFLEERWTRERVMEHLARLTFPNLTTGLPGIASTNLRHFDLSQPIKQLLRM